MSIRDKHRFHARNKVTLNWNFLANRYRVSFAASIPIIEFYQTLPPNFSHENDIIGRQVSLEKEPRERLLILLYNERRNLSVFRVNKFFIICKDIYNLTVSLSFLENVKR